MKKPYLVRVMKKAGNDKEFIVDASLAHDYTVARDTFMCAYLGDDYAFVVVECGSGKTVERIEGQDNPYNKCLPPQERRQEMRDNISFIVKKFDSNRQCIEDYDVFKYKSYVEKLKHDSAASTKEEFSAKLRINLMSRFWSRSEYELVVKRTDEGRILLSPWVGCRDKEAATIDVTDDAAFDWKGFAAQHIANQRFVNEAKVDIWDQICYAGGFERLVDMLWEAEHEEQRKEEDR